MDVLTRAAHTFDGKTCDVPDDLQDDLENYREALIEAAAENDESCWKSSSAQALTEDEIARGVRSRPGLGLADARGLHRGRANLGVKELMDLLVKYAASPVDKGREGHGCEERRARHPGPTPTRPLRPRF